MTSTLPAVETWATCTREPVCRASMTSRATIVSSAMPGQPGRPSRPDSSPSWQQARGPARCGSWACWETTPPKARTYSSARRMTRASVTHLPSSEKTLTRARERCMSPSSASSSPSRPLVTAPTGLDVDQAGGAAQVEDPLGGLGRVGDRAGVGHREHRGEAADRGGGGPGGDRLGVLAAGLAQVGVEVDQTGKRHEPVGVEDVGALAERIGADLGDHPVLDEEVLAAAAERGPPR